MKSGRSHGNETRLDRVYIAAISLVLPPLRSHVLAAVSPLWAVTELRVDPNEGSFLRLLRCRALNMNRRNLLILLPSPDRLFLPLNISKVPFDAKTLH